MGIMLDNINLGGGGPNPEVADYVIYFDSADALDHSHKHPSIATPTDSRWYRIYKSGWVVQGGYGTANINPLTLIIPMSSSTYNITLASRAGSRSAAAAIGIYEKNTTSISVYGTNTNGTNTGWDCPYSYKIEGYISSSLM